MERYLMLNGPNLDMLGIREPGVYGTESLAALETIMKDYAESKGVVLDAFQSNSEGVLIDKLHEAHFENVAGIIYNPAAHTHYSYALRDAVAAISVPVVEVHLSDIAAREDFRHTSVIADECIAQIKGKGFDGYKEALDLLIARTETQEGDA